MKQSNKQSKWSLLPLGYKSVIYFMSFALIAVAFLWCFQIAFLESSYTAIKQNQITNCANEITEKLLNSRATVESIDSISKENEMSVYIYDSSSEILMFRYSSEYNNPTGRFDVSASQAYSYYKLAEENNGVYIQTEDLHNHFFRNFKEQPPSENNGKNLIYAKIIKTDTAECFVIVSAMITPVNSVMEALTVQLSIVTVFFIIFAIILALIVGKHISKPIVQLNTSVKELAKQNYNIEFNGSGYLEVKELSDTLNFTKDELAKTEKLQQELIANVSHDLRTPLTMITGYAEVIRDLPMENTPENIQVIIDEANHLSTLVNDLLDLSKLQSGVMTLQKETYNLTQSIEDIFNNYVKLIKQEGYTIHFAATENVFIYADKVKMGQVIYNFINNAITHCGADKTVIVNQKIFNNRVQIEVIDHGEGITPEKLDYIWDRYYKVDKEHKRGVIGTGLGLSIVKNILGLHKATYGVKSKVGVGSLFWFEMDYHHIEPKN